MKTRALLLALPLLALAGCRDNRASITLTGICALSTSCRFAGKCDAYYAGEPVIDAATSPTGYLPIFIEAENQMPDNADKNIRRTNTNDAHVDEIVVEYGGLALPRQVMGTQQLVPAASSSVIGVNLIPASLGAQPALAAYAPTATTREMTATVTLRGYFDDGTRFETGEYPIAVQVCSGCLTPCAVSTACPPGVDGVAPRACN